MCATLPVFDAADCDARLQKPPPGSDSKSAARQARGRYPLTAGCRPESVHLPRTRTYGPRRDRVTRKHYDCPETEYSETARTSPMIHQTAVVSENTVIAPDVSVGPYAIIEDDVKIGAGSVIGPHVLIRRYSRIGENNTIDAGAVIGGLPQHTGFDGAETWVVIGDGNTLREGVTINRAYEAGGVTTVGSSCYLMTGAHVGHDCRVGDNVILTNGVVLGGHVTVGVIPSWVGMPGHTSSSMSVPTAWWQGMCRSGRMPCRIRWSAVRRSSITG